MGSNILVERIAVEKVSAGGIIINPEREDATALGVVRAVGAITTKDGGTAPIDIVPGERCCFLWFYAERHTNKQVQQRIGENFVFLKWEDISLVWPADEPHTISDIKSS